MIPLFDSDSLPPSLEPLEEGAVLLRRFASSEAPVLLEEVERIAQAAPFRHLVTPGGHTMSVAMTNSGRVGWVSEPRRLPLRPRWTPIPARLGLRCPRHSWTSPCAPPPRPASPHYDPDACLINRYARGRQARPPSGP